MLRNADPDDVPLARVLLDYWHKHAEHIPSSTQAKIALGLWNSHFGGITVSQVTPQAQRDFVNALAKVGHSTGYISRTLSVGRAAIRRAWKAGEIKSAPFVMEVESAADRRGKDPKGRPLTIVEMGRLLDAAQSFHILAFCMLGINTLSRPDALLGLTRDQCDFEHGIIHLNPDGRRQTRKYRPTVPMTQTIRPWLLERPHEPSRRRTITLRQDHVIAYNGRPVSSIKTAWRILRIEAGLDDRVNPYSFRHTMARELRARKVAAEEIDIMLGHLPPGNKTSLIYAPYAPDYCQGAVEAIDDYCRRLQDHTKRPITAPQMIRETGGGLA